MTRIIEPGLVRLDAPLGSEKEAVIRALAAVVSDAGRTTAPDQLASDALAREGTAATGLKGGIAIPHCRTTAVTEPTLAFARLSDPVDFGAKDGPADLVFLIAAPEGGDQTHLQLLTKLARALVRSEFVDALRSAGSPDEIVALVGGVVEDAPVAAQAAPSTTRSAAAGGGTATEVAAATIPAQGVRRIVAVTACPTGIAHTYMAAESLQAAAARAGVEIDIETQGSAGSTPLSGSTIDSADAVIFAADVGVKDRSRFAGKPLVASGVKRAIDEPDTMISEALATAADPQGSRVEGVAGAPQAASSGGHGDEHWGLTVRRILMTGVSYMIPFVAAGGLLIALAFLLGGYEIAVGDAKDTIMNNNTLFNLPDASALGLDHALGGLGAYLGAAMLTIGGTAFGFLVPALAGYIAYAIADRPGIAPGFVMGAIATSSYINAGFLGGIVGGVLAGVVAHWIAQRPVPTWMRGLMPVVVIPLGATLISGLLMLIVLAKPLSALMSSLTDGLNSLSGGSAIVLGAILGLMMAFDMGGPLNKTAYVFAITGLGTASAAASGAPELKVMAAVMLAGMTPPLGLALATVLRRSLFTEAERENGKAAWLLGASFISEGAIPFAAADPLRVIPSIMLGSAVTGALSMTLDVSLRAPHGGIFVLFAVGNILGFLIALVAGTVITALAVIGLKGLEDKAEIAELSETVTVA